MSRQHVVYDGIDGHGLPFIKCTCGHTVKQGRPESEAKSAEELRLLHLTTV